MSLIESNGREVRVGGAWVWVLCDAETLKAIADKWNLTVLLAAYLDGTPVDGGLPIGSLDNISDFVLPRDNAALYFFLLEKFGVPDGDHPE